MIKIADGVLEDVRALSHEMLVQGETSRTYPIEGEPMFSIVTDRDQLETVIGEIEVDETPIFIGRISEDDAQSVLPNNR